MRKHLILFVIVLLLALLSSVSAQSGQQGYAQVQTPPVSGMHPVGHTFNLDILNAGTGQVQTHAARVDGYIYWYNPAGRPADYYVTVADFPGTFFIFNQETVDNGGRP